MLISLFVHVSRYIKDSLQRLAEDGSLKIVTTMLESSLENSRAGHSTPMFYFAIATWIRYLCCFDEQGNEIEVKDVNGFALTEMARNMLGVVAGESKVKPPKDHELLRAFLCKVFGLDFSSNDNLVINIYYMLIELVNTSTKEVMIRLNNLAGS